MHILNLIASSSGTPVSEVSALCLFCHCLAVQLHCQSKYIMIRIPEFDQYRRSEKENVNSMDMRKGFPSRMNSQKSHRSGVKTRDNSDYFYRPQKEIVVSGLKTLLKSYYAT